MRPGVLSQVARLFSRKGFNIESLAVRRDGRARPSPASPSRCWRRADDQTQLVTRQLSQARPRPRRAPSLRRAFHPARAGAVQGARPTSRSVRNEVIQLANIFRASILDVSTASLTLAVFGDETKSEALMTLLREFGILEIAAQARRPRARPAQSHEGGPRITQLEE